MRQIGTVKFYNAQKGFGFIKPDDGGKDVFVHVTAVERAGIGNLDEGMRVSVDTFNPAEASAGAKAGAELILSVNRANRDDDRGSAVGSGRCLRDGGEERSSFGIVRTRGEDLDRLRRTPRGDRPATLERRRRQVKRGRGLLARAGRAGARCLRPAGPGRAISRPVAGTRSGPVS